MFLDISCSVIFIILGTTDFQSTIQCSCMSYENLLKTPKIPIDTLFVYFFQHNIYFNLIGRFNGKIKILHDKE